MEVQSQKEMEYVYQYWVEHFAPKGFIDSAENATKIVDELIRLNIAHPVTFEKFTKVCNLLGDVIQYKGTAAPPAATTKESATKEWKRGPRPATKVDVKSEADAFVDDMNDINSLLFFKVQNEAQHEVDKAINQDCTYQNTRGRIDWPLTNHRREILRGIKIVHPSKNAKGQEVILYTEMLAQIRKQLAQFDRKDRQRDYIR